MRTIMSGFNQGKDAYCVITREGTGNIFFNVQVMKRTYPNPYFELIEAEFILTPLYFRKYPNYTYCIYYETPNRRIEDELLWLVKHAQKVINMHERRKNRP